MKILLIDSEIEDIRELKKMDSLGGLRRGECGNGLQRKDGQGNGKKFRNQTLSSAVRKSLRMEERHF